MPNNMILEPGLWNAWTGMLPLQVSGIVLMQVNKKVVKRATDTSWNTPLERRWSFASIFMMILLLGVSVWVPYQPGTLLFVPGMMLYAVAFAGHFYAVYTYAATPLTEPAVKGMYRLSRNPLYLFYSAAALGLVLASASVPFLLVWMVYNIPTHFVIRAEERYCSETYGRSYRAYMEGVPRYFLFF